MKRIMVTRKKFYDIRRNFKALQMEPWGRTPTEARAEVICFAEISPSTLTKVLQARNFKEYKQLVNLYSRTMKKLKRRILFILAVTAIVLLFINLSK